MIDIQRALGTLERYAPAEDDVLSGLRKGITRRRRRRQVASVVGVGGAAALVALGVVLVSPEQTGGGGTPAAPPAPGPATVKIANPLEPPVLPFTVGWLPAGYKLDAWETAAAESSAQFVGGKDFQLVVVWISDEPRQAGRGDTEEPTTIGGRPGVLRKLVEDRAETQLIWQLADGRWAMVGGRTPMVQLSALRRVADSVTTQPTTLNVPLTLNGLPDGYLAARWNGGGLLAGSVTLCRAALDTRARGIPGDCVVVTLNEGTAPASQMDKVERDPKKLVEQPIDREKVVNGVRTRATADGTTVVAQVNAGRWVQVWSQQAGVDLLRQVASTAKIR